MSEVVAMSSSRRAPQRIPLDRDLEVIATAARFAWAIANGIITPELKVQAEMYVTYGTPVRKYQGGKPVEGGAS